MASNLPLLRTILAAGILSWSSAATAQGERPPAAAQTHFQKAHPGAVVKEWEKKTKHYKVDFKEKDEKYESYYTLDGAWVRTEHDIQKSKLPATVSAAVAAGKYGSWKVDDVEEHSTPEHAVLYKVQVEKEPRKVELFLTPDGKLLREQEDAK